MLSRNTPTTPDQAPATLLDWYHDSPQQPPTPHQHHATPPPRHPRHPQPRHITEPSTNKGEPQVGRYRRFARPPDMNIGDFAHRQSHQVGYFGTYGAVRVARVAARWRHTYPHSAIGSDVRGTGGVWTVTRLAPRETRPCRCPTRRPARSCRCPYPAAGAASDRAYGVRCGRELRYANNELQGKPR